MNPFSRLNSRQLAILQTIDEYKLATTSQIMRLHFDDGSTLRSRQVRVNRVLDGLTKQRHIKRIGRTIGGALGGGSSELVCVNYGSSAGSAPLHTIAITELYTRLIQAHRAGRLELLSYQPEDEGYRQYGNTTVTCDARIRVRTLTGTYPVFIEIDRGNRRSAEFRKQLKAKMNRYVSAQAQRTRNIFPMVLFLCLDTERKEFIESVVKTTTLSELFTVILFDEAVDYISAL